MKRGGNNIMKYYGWLIYSREDSIRNSDYIEWMLKEARLLNINLVLKIRENFIMGIKDSRSFIKYTDMNEAVNENKVSFYNSQSDNLPQFIVNRNIDTAFTKQLEIIGIKVYNNSFVSEICNDKALTHQYLSQFHIPMLDTMFTRANDTNINSINIPYPLIVKEVHGRGGKQVYKAQTEKELKNIMENLGSKKIIIQKFAEVPGKDLRVFVVGKKIIGAVLRTSEVDFKANYTLGGSAAFYTLSEKEENLVQKIITKFNFGMVGIDFLFDKNGDILLNEIEDVVGSRTLSKTSKINIVKIYLEEIIREIGDSSVKFSFFDNFLL